MAFGPQGRGDGLGQIDRVEVRWPSGLSETFVVPLDAHTTVVEGEGRAP